MVLMQLDIQKKLGTEFWTNVYHLEFVGTSQDQTAVDGIIAAERSIHSNFVNFVSARVKEAGSPHGYSQIIPLTGYGSYVFGGQDALPMFNVLRVDFSPVIGMPSRKYLRTLFTEAAVTGSEFIAEYVTFVQDHYMNAILQSPAPRNDHGFDLVSGSVKTTVAMRQLRRGSKRKIRPVIPVA